MNPRILVRTFVAAAAATLTVRFFNGPMHGASAWGVLGTEVPVEFGRFETRKYAAWELIVFVLFGVAGGLLGALFNQVNLWLSKWRMRHIGGRGHKRFLEALLVGAVIISFNFFAHFMAGGEAPVVTEEHGMDPHANMVAPENPQAQKLFNMPGGEAIKALFHEKGTFDQRVLLFFGFTHFVQMIWTYGMGVPSGLFVPSLLCGAIFGRSMGQLLQHLHGSVTSPGTFALIGATAMLSGVARITISLAVILLETTGEAEWGVPLFITVMSAKWIGDLFNKGIYDTHIELRHVPILEQRPEQHMKTLTAKDIMATQVVTLPATARMNDVLRTIEGCTHNGFPILDTCGHFIGMVERSTLHHVFLSLRAREVALAASDGSAASRPASVAVDSDDGERDLEASPPSAESPTRQQHRTGGGKADLDCNASQETCNISDGVEEVEVSSTASVVPYEEMLRHGYPRLAPAPTAQLLPPRWRPKQRQISGEDGGRLVDLRPYADCSGFVVQEHTSEPRCHMLFRTMGLRHLPVIGCDGSLRGIITRKDLIDAVREAPSSQAQHQVEAAVHEPAWN